MPSLDDIEMGNSSSSETREVEMADAADSPEAADDENAAYNGHMTSEEVNGKSDDDKDGPINVSENGDSSSDAAPTAAMPSVEPDGGSSPATADEEMASPGQNVNTTSSTKLGNIQPDPEPPTASQSIKMDKEIARLHEVLNEVSPEAAQKVLKEKWRMFLFENYDEAHIAFILRAGLKNSNQTILERVLKDDGAFKDTILKVGMKKPDFVEKVLRKTSAEVIAAQIPEETMDYVIAERFKTVPGKTLIKWLATAERLGYKADDILDEEDESVSPNLPSRDSSVELLDIVPTTYEPAAYGAPYQAHPYPQYPQHPQQPQQPQQQPYLANPHKDPLLVEQERQASLNKQQAQHVQAAIAKNSQASLHRGPGQTPARQEQSRAAVPTGPLMCTLCRRSFPPGGFKGYTYHISKKVCEKVPPSGGYKWKCPDCLSGFTTKQGLDYHCLRKVCVGEGIAPPTPSSVNPYPLPPIVNSNMPPQPPRMGSTPSMPPSRPTYNPTPPTQAPLQSPNTAQVMVSSSQYPSSSGPITQTPQPPVQIPRPPISTPHRGAGRPRIEEEVRYSLSELTPQQRAALDQAIQDAETDCAEKIAAIPLDFSAEERQRRITSINYGNATKKSQIRRAHGVSLRMREKDKQARVAAGISPAASSRIQEFKASSSSAPSGSPPSFSPINDNAATSRPLNGYSGPPQPATAYRQPPPGTATKIFNPMSTQPSGRDVPLTHARQDASSPSGFGILKATAPLSSYGASYHANPEHISNKRKYGSQEPIGVSRNGTPQSLMMEVSAEDAASKFAKGYQKKMAQREREDRGRNGDMSMTEAPRASSSGNTVIAIDISSDSEDVELPIVKSGEADGEAADTPENEPRRSLGPKMARRGGKH